MSQPPTICRITQDEINLNDLLARISLNSSGASAIFSGMVRGELHQIEYLEYEAYIPTAKAKMRQVAAEIRSYWSSIQRTAIVQRIGKRDPRTPTVLIPCTAAHRDTDVFEATRYGIHRLKQIVPIWKKEISPDGTEWIEGDYHPRPGE